MLTERQLGIVLAVVYEYIKTGEPSGSRAITKKYIKGLSPATIRNEMSDLEDMEFFYQPHASAGRLPTPKAYRLYVDTIMQRSRLRPKESETWRDELNSNRSDVEKVLSQVTRMLSSLTSYVSVAAVSTLDETAINRIDFAPLGGESVILLIILQTGLVYHGQFTLPAPTSPEDLEKLSRRINTIASGRTWGEVREVLYNYVLSGLEDMEGQCRAAILEMEQLMENNQYRLFSSGARKILGLPDAREISHLQAVLSLLEEERPLAEAVERCKAAQELKVSIGDENLEGEMKESSLILLPAATSGQKVVLGIIGPMHMDYERSISILEGMAFAMQDKNRR